MESVWFGLLKSPQHFPSNCTDPECRRQHWQWSDSGTTTAAAYFFWASEEPSHDASCARLRNDGYWAEINCDHKFHYVCEGAITGEI